MLRGRSLAYALLVLSVLGGLGIIMLDSDDGVVYWLGWVAFFAGFPAAWHLQRIKEHKDS